jgi:iron complex outermembrane recepter protein
VVTAARRPQPRLEVPGSISRIDAGEIDLRGSTHAAELLNEVPGVMVQRGSGQESLMAIRSPVLAGPGACGAFLLLEDGMPLRPIGTCNINEIFEVNSGQASAIEVIRGPATAIYGANAVHGIVNVITPAVADLARWRLGAEAGPDRFARASFAAADAAFGLGAYGAYSHDGGFRVDSATDDSRLNLLLDREVAGGELRLRAAGTVLNQETAGFIRGLDAYRDPQLRRSNQNPEAFRDAWSARASAAWRRSGCDGCVDQWQLVARRSSMEFLQHFLLGKPLERNGQRSVAWSGGIERPLGGATHWSAGLDLELADSTLLEVQAGPTMEGSAAARAIRPAGRHYDYDVRSRSAGAYAAIDWPLAPRLLLQAALRADATRYAYDNRMLDGNTSDAGVACAAGGCLYSRPADRDDSFRNLAPRLELSWAASARDRWYLAAASGFRPPETTELYRLQRQQVSAALGSERLRSAELGWRGERRRLRASVAAYAMDKRHVILRDSNGYNASDGHTTHRGIEYELQLALAPSLRVSLDGTVAWHRYAFSRTIDGGETITAGNDVDTAPRHLNRLALDWRLPPGFAATLELAQVGAYFADAANLHRYPGHAVMGARAAWQLTPRLRTSLRIENLLDRAYADRADFAQGEWRYFPARGRSVFVELAVTAPGS